MEYKPTTLPQYWPITPRQDFDQAAVQPNHVLLFSQDGQSITAKLPDGSFVVIGSDSGGACPQSVRPYVLFVSNGQAFNGNYIATSDSFNNAPVYELTQ